MLHNTQATKTIYLFRSRELSVIKVKVIHQMLIEIPFGEGEDKRGLPKLCKRGIFQDYYPLHDGNIQYEYWYNDDLLNDRTVSYIFI